MYLQVEVLQISQALEDLAWEGTETTAVQVKGVEPIQSVKGVFSQGAQVAVVSEVQLLQQREAMEGRWLNVRYVVGVDPESDSVGAEVAS